MLNIDSLDSGIVIDHIKAGSSMEIYRYLRLDQLDCCVAIIKNAKSNKYGKKDIIKIDADLDVDLNALGYIDSDITINIIENGKRVKKYHPELPEYISNVVKCKNPRCITTTEQELPHVFKLTDRKNKIYRCIYCESKAERQQ